MQLHQLSLPTRAAEASGEKANKNFLRCWLIINYQKQQEPWLGFRSGCNPASDSFCYSCWPGSLGHRSTEAPSPRCCARAPSPSASLQHPCLGAGAPVTCRDTSDPRGHRNPGAPRGVAAANAQAPIRVTAAARATGAANGGGRRRRQSGEPEWAGRRSNAAATRRGSRCGLVGLPRSRSSLWVKPLAAAGAVRSRFTFAGCARNSSRSPPALASPLTLASAVPGGRSNGVGWARSVSPCQLPRCGAGSVSQAAAVSSGHGEWQSREQGPAEATRTARAPPGPGRVAPSPAPLRARRSCPPPPSFGPGTGSWPRVPDELEHHGVLSSASLVAHTCNPGTIAAPFWALHPSSIF